jgi:hypothetical protein
VVVSPFIVLQRPPSERWSARAAARITAPERVWATSQDTINQLVVKTVTIKANTT